eukprot:5486701-Pyramimonas_sp.AAC.1
MVPQHARHRHRHDEEQRRHEREVRVTRVAPLGTPLQPGVQSQVEGGGVAALVVEVVRGAEVLHVAQQRVVQPCGWFRAV